MIYKIFSEATCVYLVVGLLKCRKTTYKFGLIVILHIVLRVLFLLRVFSTLIKLSELVLYYLDLGTINYFIFTDPFTRFHCFVFECLMANEFSIFTPMKLRLFWEQLQREEP
jgi:hypothetical protein